MGGCATKPKEFDDSRPGSLPSDAPVSSEDKQPAFDANVTPDARLDHEKDNLGEKQENGGEKQGETPLVDLSEPERPKVQEGVKETPAFDEPVSAESAAAVDKVETNVIASHGKIDDPVAKKPDAKENPAFDQSVSADSMAVLDKVETNAMALDGKIEDADAQKLEAKEKPPEAKVQDKADEHNLLHKVLQHFR